MTAASCFFAADLSLVAVTANRKPLLAESPYREAYCSEGEGKQCLGGWPTSQQCSRFKQPVPFRELEATSDFPEDYLSCVIPLGCPFKRSYTPTMKWCFRGA